MANRIISDLIGTMRSFFRIGTAMFKDNSGTLEAKNIADSAYVPLATSQQVLKGSTSGATTFSASATAAGDYIFPAADGSTGYVLSTNGSGQLSWVSTATASNQGKAQSEAVEYNSSTPISVFTPPANSTIERVVIDVDTAFDASAPNISVGVAGETSRYMGTTDVDLKTAGVYEVAPMYQEDGTPEAVIITFAPSTGGSAGSANVTVFYVNPD